MAMLIAPRETGAAIARIALVFALAAGGCAIDHEDRGCLVGIVDTDDGASCPRWLGDHVCSRDGRWVCTDASIACDPRDGPPPGERCWCPVGSPSATDPQCRCTEDGWQCCVDHPAGCCGEPGLPPCECRGFPLPARTCVCDGIGWDCD
jgi:hypothetical protein